MAPGTSVYRPSLNNIPHVTPMTITVLLTDT